MSLRGNDFRKGWRSRWRSARGWEWPLGRAGPGILQPAAICGALASASSRNSETATRASVHEGDPRQRCSEYAEIGESDALTYPDNTVRLDGKAVSVRRSGHPHLRTHLALQRRRGSHESVCLVIDEPVVFASSSQHTDVGPLPAHGDDRIAIAVEGPRWVPPLPRHALRGL